VAVAATMTSFLSSFFGGKTAVAPLSQTALTSQIEGKSFLVVGGTKGIGAAVSRALLERGAQVTIAGRSKCEETPDKAQFIQADVGTVKAARALVREDLKGRKFDTVIFTVGIITRSKLTRTSDGIEEDLAVSYLSRFVIANELILADTLEGRKRMYIWGYPGQNIEPTDITDINFERTPYAQWGGHMNTVLFNEALVYELAHRHSDLHVFGLNPGLIRTGIRDNVHGGESSIKGKIVETLIGLTMQSVDQYVATTVLPLLASPELEKKTAVCFSKKGEELPIAPWLQDASNREKVWEASQALVSKVDQSAPKY